MRQIILDTETTGLDPTQGHRIVEIGAVEVLGRSISGRDFHVYLNPERDSDPEALRVHGLSSDFLAQHARFDAIAQEFIDYIRGAELIIHNAPFDVKFLNAELARCGLPDSLQVARELHPGKRNNLDALCERYGIANAHRTLHGALLDAELLAEVWLAMTRGQDSLLMDFDDAGTTGAHATAHATPVDTAALKVLPAQAHEIEAHAAYLAELDKAAKGACLWRRIEAPTIETPTATESA